jgi:hypothetical protein
MKPNLYHSFWVVRPCLLSHATHLGHELHESGTMEYDARVKKAQFISNSLEVREMFSFASPAEVLRTLKVYTCSLYGSNLWELGGEMAKQVYNAWWTGVRLAWDVPRATRSYLAHHVLCPDLTPVKVDVLAKFVGFFKGLRASPSPEVSFMAFYVGRDLRTTTGRNLRLISNETGADPWSESPAKIKKVLAEQPVEIPDIDRWRIPYLGSLLEKRQMAHYSGNEILKTSLADMIDSLCIN